MLLDDELRSLVDSEIAVIMNDGQAYRGTLIRFEKDVIVLNNIYEATNQEVEWVEAKDEADKSITKGYLPWKKVTLPEVIIRLPMVLRIWPWSPEGQPQ